MAVVTGVSRRIGIGYAIARRLAGDGAAVVAHHWSPHDADQPWGPDPLGGEGVVDALRRELPDHAHSRITGVEADFVHPAGAFVVMDAAAAAFGHVDIVVANHRQLREPGPTDTGYADDATRRLVSDRHPQGRWSSPDDAARLVAWLCSDEARWVTGQTIVSDGGAGPEG